MREQAKCSRATYATFFEDGEVRADFRKEYISLWAGWLGEGRLHLLDKVSDGEWLRFNRWLLAVFQAFGIGVVNRKAEAIEFPARLEPLLNDRAEAIQKDASQFSWFVIPALDCVITEEWNYTYILWHRDRRALEALKPLLSDANLHHFSD